MKINPFIPYVFTGKVGDFVSPSYDTISPKEMKRLLSMKYNVTHLIAKNNGRATFERMIDHGLLKQHGEKFIILVQKFRFSGKNMTRIGIIGAVDPSNERTKLFPHENTFEEFVEYRKRTFEELMSQVEPIFVVVPLRKLDEKLNLLISNRKPDLSFTSADSVRNYVYMVGESDSISSIQKYLLYSVGYIADGHHRFRALTEINERRASEGKRTVSVLCYLTSLYSESLLINGINRVAKLKSRQSALTKVSSNFKVSGPIRKPPEERMAIYDGEMREIVPTETSSTSLRYMGVEEAQFTDYSDMLILPDIFNGSKDFSGQELRYVANQEEALEMVNSNKGTLAILIPPWSKRQFVKVARSGRLMRPKSTYFFPKIPAGIAVYKME